MPDILPDVEAELNRRSVAVVSALLRDAVGIGPSAPFPLYRPGLENPNRSYVEGWIARNEAEERATSARRHEEATKPAQDAAKYAWWAVIVGAIAAAAGVVAAVLSAIPLFK